MLLPEEEKEEEDDDNWAGKQVCNWRGRKKTFSSLGMFTQKLNPTEVNVTCFQATVYWTAVLEQQNT